MGGIRFSCGLAMRGSISSALLVSIHMRTPPILPLCSCLLTNRRGHPVQVPQQDACLQLLAQLQLGEEPEQVSRLEGLCCGACTRSCSRAVQRMPKHRLALSVLGRLGKQGTHPTRELGPLPSGHQQPALIVPSLALLFFINPAGSRLPPSSRSWARWATSSSL